MTSRLDGLRECDGAIERLASYLEQNQMFHAASIVAEHAKLEHGSTTPDALYSASKTFRATVNASLRTIISRRHAELTVSR